MLREAAGDGDGRALGPVAVGVDVHGTARGGGLLGQPHPVDLLGVHRGFVLRSRRHPPFASAERKRSVWWRTTWSPQHLSRFEAKKQNLKKNRLGFVQPEGNTGFLTPYCTEKSRNQLRNQAESLRTNQSLDFAISLSLQVNIDRRSDICHRPTVEPLQSSSHTRRAHRIFTFGPDLEPRCPPSSSRPPRRRLRAPRRRSQRHARDGPKRHRAPHALLAIPARVPRGARLGLLHRRRRQGQETTGHQTPDRQSRAPRARRRAPRRQRDRLPQRRVLHRDFHAGRRPRRADARRHVLGILHRGGARAPAGADRVPQGPARGHRPRRSPQAPRAQAPVQEPRSIRHVGHRGRRGGQLPVRRMLHRVRRPGGRLRADSTPRLPGNQALRRGGQGEVARAAAKPEGAARRG